VAIWPLYNFELVSSVFQILRITYTFSFNNITNCWCHKWLYVGFNPWRRKILFELWFYVSCQLKYWHIIWYHTPKFLNTIVFSKLPNHILRLKVGVSVMLLRNIDQSLGLCNGTRLIITKGENMSLKVE
jgi:hypothetical protein